MLYAHIPIAFNQRLCYVCFQVLRDRLTLLRSFMAWAHEIPAREPAAPSCLALRLRRGGQRIYKRMADMDVYFIMSICLYL